MEIGPHVNRSFAKTGSSITKHIIAARKQFYDFHICNLFSIFVSSPKQKRIIMKDEDCAELAAYIKSQNITVIAHSTYASSPWKGEKVNIDFIRAEVKACEMSSIHGLVVHLPKAPMETVIQYVNDLIVEGTSVRIYLETPATVRPYCYFDTPDKINKLFASLDFKHFGICIDTAHLHTNGVALTTAADMKAYLQLINKNIPLMFHLNDSERKLGTGPDSHAALCKGHIWQHDNTGLIELIKYATENCRPIILERDENLLYESDFKIITDITNITDITCSNMPAKSAVCIPKSI